MAEKTGFEKSLRDLEKIVADLEKADQPLEAQLKSFEKGVALSRDCLKQLDEIEKKVEILVQTGDGTLQTAPFETPTEA